MDKGRPQSQKLFLIWEDVTPGRVVMRLRLACMKRTDDHHHHFFFFEFNYFWKPYHTYTKLVYLGNVNPAHAIFLAHKL